MPQQALLGYIRQAVESIPSLRVLVVSGGEPFLLGADLDDAVALGARLGLVTRVVTNGYWATSPARAKDRLLRLRAVGLREFNVSSGDAHAAFVPPERVVNACVAAMEVGLTTVAVVEKTAHGMLSSSRFATDPRIKDAMRRSTPGAFRVQDGLWMQTWGPTVVAPDCWRCDDRTARFSGPCPSVLASVSIAPDERVSACCGLAHGEISELSAWDGQATPLREIVEEMQWDLVKIWLHLEGPVKILQWAAGHEPELKWQNRYAHQCEACRAVYKDPLVRKAIAGHVDEVRADLLLRFSLLRNAHLFFPARPADRPVRSRGDGRRSRAPSREPSEDPGERATPVPGNLSRAAATGRSRGCAAARKPLINSVNFLVTDACNLACRYCYSKAVRKHADRATGRQTVKWLVGVASGEASKVTLGFFGGEPLLRWDLIRELVPYAEDEAAAAGKALSLGMVTNGTMLKPDLCKEISHHNFSVVVSLDGRQPVHDSTRVTAAGKGSWQEAVSGIRSFLSYSRRITVRPTITPHNVERLFESVCFVFDELGIDTVAAYPVWEADWSELSLAVLDREIGKIAARFCEEVEQGQIRKFDMLMRAIGIATSRRRGPFPCGAGRGFAGIAPDGTVYSCHRFVSCARDSEFCHGSVYDENLPANRGPLAAYDISRMEASGSRQCAACEVKTYCRGGCPAVFHEVNGSIYRPVPGYCGIVRVLARHAEAIVERFRGKGCDAYERCIREFVGTASPLPCGQMGN